MWRQLLGGIPQARAQRQSDEPRVRTASGVRERLGRVPGDGPARQPGRVWSLLVSVRLDAGASVHAAVLGFLVPGEGPSLVPVADADGGSLLFGGAL